MKHKILKKTLVYRLIALSLGLLLPYLITQQLIISITVGLITESISLVTYYLYEYLWEKRINKINWKDGKRIWLDGLEDINDTYGWFKVVEDLGDGKMVIEVE